MTVFRGINNSMLCFGFCLCALISLIIVGGLGYIMMKRRRNEDAAAAKAPTKPPLTPAPAHTPIPDPSTTSSSEVEEKSDPDDMLELDTEHGSALTPPEDLGEIARPEPVPTPVATPDPLSTPTVMNETVPDPSVIAGLDTPIVAADTLDDDDAETPTVIIAREPKKKGDT